MTEETRIVELPDSKVRFFGTKEARLAFLFEQVLKEIPFLDTSDPNLTDTPSRMARMFVDMFSGLDPSNEPKITTFPVDGEKPGLVGTGKIFFASMCAHHFLPFIGHAHVFYIPDKKLVGLSKFTRIVTYYAARPQIQERMAVQIADHIMRVSECRGCFVVLRATHGCMQCRGVKQEGAVMVTPVIRPLDDSGDPCGPFAKQATRDEALSLMEMEK
jgi:GTP cyclohydrolase IA